MKNNRQMSKLQLMQAATMIQNPRVMPRKVTPEEVVNREPFLDSPITGAPLPRSAREVEGMSGGVMKADRAEGESQ